MKNIAILLCGEMRNNMLSLNPINSKFTDTFYKNVITQEVRNNYNIHIFIVSDNGNIETIIQYFKELKNLYLMNINYTHINTLLEIESEDYYKNLYIDTYQNSKFTIYPTAIQQYYKIYLCYLLMKDYEKKNINFDYIMRCRLDSIFFNINFISIIDNLNNIINEKIYLDGDWFIFGTYKIMSEYSKLLLTYGNFNLIDSNNCNNNIDLNRWNHAPETQLMELLIKYCKNNSLEIDNTIIDMRKTKRICSLSRWDKY